MARLIDADELKKSIKEDEKLKSSSVAYLLMNLMTCYIDDAPTIDAEPVKNGHWKSCRFSDGGLYQEQCSVCGGWSHDIGNYCPDCGADMRGTEDE